MDIRRVQGSSHPDIALWRQYVRRWFPGLHERAYFVPPVYTNRVHYETVRFAGLNVDIRQPPETVLRRWTTDDQAQQRILHCLLKLAETQGEPMVVISQLQFGDYLNNPCYAAAAGMLPRPIDLKMQGKHRGDFDLLLIHKHYGLVVGEIKTVGHDFSSLRLTEQQQDDLVAKKVQQAVAQLDKAGDALTHLVSDLQHPPRVRKTLMLPNINRWQLQRVLDPLIRQDLCRCLGIEQHADPIDLCLTAEHLTDRNTPWDVTDDVLRKLSQWWSTAVASRRVLSTEADYVDLVARFAGPASTVQIFGSTQPPLHFRSEEEGVEETSRRFTRDIVLTPHQLDILNRNLPLVFLCGPPGTGKTVMLVVRARDWLYRGYHVHVLSLWAESLAVSHLIVHKLQQDAGHAIQRVHLHVFNFYKGKHQMETAVKVLVTAASQGPLCVVVDEVPSSSRYFTDFCNELCHRIPELCLWAASLYHDIRPPCLTEVPMTEPLRTPPVITRHVQQSDSIKPYKTVRDYTVRFTPPPCDGPAPRVLYHTGPGHSAGSSLHCMQCGENVASVLRELYDSVGDPPVTTTSATTENFRTNTGQALQYRDTIILCDTPLDDLPVVSILRARGLPVQVVTSDDDKAAIRDVALASRDVVIVTDWRVVSRLERMIVVVFGREYGSDVDRLLQMSRSTSLLIWVEAENSDPLERLYFDLREETAVTLPRPRPVLLRSRQNYVPTIRLHSGDLQYRHTITPPGSPSHYPSLGFRWSLPDLLVQEVTSDDDEAANPDVALASLDEVAAAKSNPKERRYPNLHKETTFTLPRQVEDTLDMSGDTELIRACRHGQSDIANVLLDRGADVKIRNEEGNTALHFASRYTDSRLIQRMIKNGGNFNQLNNDGDTPLHIACTYSNSDTVGVLLTFGADPDIANKKGNTCLHNACVRGEKDIVTLLLDHGVDINVTSKAQKTPLQLAQEHGRKDIEQLLKTALIELELSSQLIFSKTCQFSGEFSSAGGQLRGDSDVILVVPEDAIQPHEKVVIAGAVCVDLETVHDKLELPEEETIVTPAVEYVTHGSGGKFEKHLEVSIPHFLPDSFSVHELRVYQFYRADGTGELCKKPLKLLENLDDVENRTGDEEEGVFFVSEARAVLVLSSHFTGWVCTCGHQIPPHLHVRVYGKHVQRRTRDVDLFLLVCDRRLETRDFRKGMLNEEEDKALVAHNIAEASQLSGISFGARLVLGDEEKKTWDTEKRDGEYLPVEQRVDLVKLHPGCEKCRIERMDWWVHNKPGSTPEDWFRCYIDVGYLKSDDDQFTFLTDEEMRVLLIEVSDRKVTKETQTEEGHAVQAGTPAAAANIATGAFSPNVNIYNGPVDESQKNYEGTTVTGDHNSVGNTQTG